ncbi:1-acyl-sn-glycerol-3-phosphate acyltransferase [Xenorhabdus bovienii]|uniref:lysophospholipid acyltransferase family protein n=1 Tax=Xenorhabdus bovienii TaxID=40576 RepID=UPI00237CBD1D|nr:lysophospholipid acyltransferase family protein [Xenorhabdus bovienii]MDE1474946.1 1-acyl-sn-glycerol-3-phosphate acyltransferase [Xenorhabdus bovienii]MDE9497308.1 1-acyl-sn-glycerol-3-phosphate acyltransferase [Xenorhabdus bovienii]MDE9539057.1 1-acyl-sn-glycerol-3-phosphate acyltransferase [Xenorhabdus bovienii]
MEQKTAISMIERINWVWRLTMTGVCFALFGIGGLLLSLIWFNLLLVFQRNADKRCRLARHSISACFRLFFFLTRKVGVLDYHFDGIEKIRMDKGCLIVANHPTLLDYVLLASTLPDVDCIVKSALLRNPFVSGVIRSANYLINSEAESLLPICRERLTAGHNILIFPEGTRTIPDHPITLQRGAANIAVRCGCNLRVVHIICSQKMLDKKSKWYQIPPKKPIYTITVGEQLTHENFAVDAESGQAVAARQLNRQLTHLLTPSNH